MCSTNSFVRIDNSSCNKFPRSWKITTQSRFVSIDGFLEQSNPSSVFENEFQDEANRIGIGEYGQKPGSSNKGVTSDTRDGVSQWPAATNGTIGDRMSKYNQDTRERGNTHDG